MTNRLNKWVEDLAKSDSFSAVGGYSAGTQQKLDGAGKGMRKLHQVQEHNINNGGKFLGFVVDKKNFLYAAFHIAEGSLVDPKHVDRDFDSGKSNLVTTVLPISDKKSHALDDVIMTLFGIYAPIDEKIGGGALSVRVVDPRVETFTTKVVYSKYPKANVVGHKSLMIGTLESLGGATLLEGF